MDEVSAAKAASGTFLARLSEQERGELVGLGTTRIFPRGAVLMFQDEAEDRVVLLLRGRVKVLRTDPSQRELLLAIRDAGDLLGELAFVDGAPRLATVIALEEVQAVVVSAVRLRAHLETSPRVALVLLECLVARFREATLTRLQFAVADTLGRVAARLAELAERYGEPGEEGVLVAMPISQDELATWTGASRAGVAQALQTLRELGWVTTGRRRMVVRDLEALRSRAA